MGWRDRQQSRVRDAEPRAEYPWIQWINVGSTLDPRRKNGGFFLTSENLAILGEPDIPGAEASTLNFSSDETETGLYLGSIDVAILGTRFAWQTRDGNRAHLSAEYTPGARGKMQALVLLKTAEGSCGPLLLTVTGTVTKDLLNATKTHRQQVRQATGGQGATPWFWLRLLAGSTEKRGSANAQSTVTPIVMSPEPFVAEAAYVGDNLADWMEEHFEVCQQWANEWDHPQQAAEQEPDPVDPTQGPAPQEHGVGSAQPLSAARAAWSVQWNKLKGLGVAAPFLNNAFGVAQIATATDAMETAVKALEQGESKEIATANLLATLDRL